MLVRPADPASRAQLPHQIDRRPPGDHDVLVGAVRGSLRGVRDRAGVQYPDSGATAVFWGVVSDELGAVFEIWEVSGCLVLVWGWGGGGVPFLFFFRSFFIFFPCLKV